MPVMRVAAIRDVIIDTLASDSLLSPTPFSGGVLARLPRQGRGISSTPQAFYGPENPSEAGKLKPTIAVLDRGDVPSPAGEAHNGFVGFPLVYGYVPTTASGEEMLTTLDDRLRFHFNRGEVYPTGSGSGAQIILLERQSIFDGDDFGFEGRQFAIWRLEATFVRS